MDMGAEFTNLIVFQSSYGANSKVITTANTMSQDLLNLIQSARRDFRRAMEDLGNLNRVPLDIDVVLGTRMVTVSEIVALEPGSLIRMDRAAGDNVQIHVGGIWVADGDILAVDNKMCVRLTAFRERP